MSVESGGGSDRRQFASSFSVRGLNWSFGCKGNRKIDAKNHPLGEFVFLLPARLDSLVSDPLTPIRLNPRHMGIRRQDDGHCHRPSIYAR
jgi:hypothetical protein